ncbi:MAG: M23 family metallopeptidase [Verrucomicrobiales bacterium]|nr:M23 family metallopeptidase [Verrucomicrobiales bacterium]
MKKIPYLDLKQHWKEWHQLALPLFVVISAVILVLFLMGRTRDQARQWHEDLTAAKRLGLIEIKPDAIFDPAFAVASPIELVKAPTSDHFDFPVGSRLGALTYNAQPFFTNRHLGDDLNGIGGQNSDLGDPVYAISDGLVLFAGWPSDGWGNVIILQHELTNGQLIQTFYGHLDTMKVPVGSLVRRGEEIGTIGTANGRYLAHLHLEVRRYPTIDVGVGYSDSRLGRIAGELALSKWRSRPDDSLVAAPVGPPPEPKSLQLDVEAITAPTP